MRRGGLVDPSKQRRSTKRCADLLCICFVLLSKPLGKKNFGERLENCTIIFVNNPALNALALESENRRAIAIYMGALRKMWVAVRFALTLPDFLVDWFPPAPPMELGRAVLSAPAELLDYPGPGWDAGQIELLEELFLHMLDFVLHHELAHHARGHMDIMRTRLGVDVIDEALDFTSAMT